MAGLSGVFMRPRALGVTASRLRGLGIEHTPGVYAYALVGGAGGGAGGRGELFINSTAAYGKRGEQGGHSTGTIHLRSPATVSSASGGTRGLFSPDAQTTRAGGDGVRASLSSPYAGTSLFEGSGGRGGDGPASPYQPGFTTEVRYEADSIAYGGRGWGYRSRTHSVPEYSAGGAPGNSPESSSGSHGQNGRSGNVSYIRVG